MTCVYSFDAICNIMFEQVSLACSSMFGRSATWLKIWKDNVATRYYPVSHFPNAHGTVSFFTVPV